MADEQDKQVDEVQTIEIHGRVGVVTPPSRFRPPTPPKTTESGPLPQDVLFPNDSPHHV